MRSVIYTHTVTVSSFVQDIRYFQYWYAGWRSIVVHHLSYPTCPHSCWVPVWAAGACTRSSTCQSPSLMVWCKYIIKSNQSIAYHSIKSYHSMKDVKYGIYIITRQVSSIIVQRDCNSGTYWRSSTYLRSSSTYWRGSSSSTYCRSSSTYSLTYPVGWVVGSTKARRVRNAECAHVQSYPTYLNMRSYVDTERLMCILIIGA